MEYKNKQLHNAAREGNAEAVRILIEVKADVNARSWDGFTPLHKAAEEGNAEAVRILIEAKAVVNARDFRGNTPLHYAAKEKEVKALETLIKAKAIVNVDNEDGVTPLYNAVRNLRIDVVEILIEAKACVMKKTNYDVKPLSFSISEEKDKAIDKEIKKMAKNLFNEILRCNILSDVLSVIVAQYAAYVSMEESEFKKYQMESVVRNLEVDNTILQLENKESKLESVTRDLPDPDFIETPQQVRGAKS